MTKPLAEQIFEEIKECLDIEDGKVTLFTGSVAPAKREEMWKNSVVVVSTPQCIENDVINGRVQLEDISLIVADEAHNAVKDYSYTWIARQYSKKSRFPRIIGLTASPGSDMDRIQEVVKNLYIEQIEIRTDNDPDVKPYVQEIEMEWVPVNLPAPFIEVKKFLEAFVKDRVSKLRDWGILQRKNADFVNKTDLLAMQAELRAKAASGEKDYTMWAAISVLAEIMKVTHALELLETQGIVPLYKYMEKINSEAGNTKVKAVINAVRDLNFRSAFIKVQKFYEEGLEHPKLVELQRLVEAEIKEDKGMKMIVFNQYRDNAQDVVEKLNKIEGIEAKLFVGQMKKGETGLSQKEQKRIIEEFSNGEFNVLVATSIAEQGLDIPQVNLVIFYEPIPSAIRHIQRRGRTGRHDKGRVIVLMTKGTRDEGYRWSAHHKEKGMYRNLEKLKKSITLELGRKEKTLEEFSDEKKIKIYADYREKGSGVIKELAEKGVELKLESLENADYLLSSRVGVEFKTAADFVNSIIDGRLLEQVKNLRNNFERPLVVVEGTEDIYSVRNVHPNAIRGMLATIAVSFGIPVLSTKDYRDTAALLYLIAKREQEDTGTFSVHGSRKPMSLGELQEYIISSLPGVGSVLAKPLLKEFGTIKNVVNADVKELEKVEGIGPKKAKQINEIVNKEYNTLE